MQPYDRNRTDGRATVRRMRLTEEPRHVKTVRTVVGRRRDRFRVRMARLQAA